MLKHHHAITGTVTKVFPVKNVSYIFRNGDCFRDLKNWNVTVSALFFHKSTKHFHNGIIKCHSVSYICLINRKKHAQYEYSRAFGMSYNTF